MLDNVCSGNVKNGHLNEIKSVKKCSKYAPKIFEKIEKSKIWEDEKGFTAQHCLQRFWIVF